MHHYDGDPNAREQYRDHPFFEDCEQFCERWDQASFDPDYESLPLSFFAPLVHTVFGRKAYDPQFLRPGERESLVNATLAAERKP